MTTRIVILAGGKGKRMKSELPKVLVPLHGKPMLIHLLTAVQASLVDPKPVIVIGNGGDLVKKVAGENYTYAMQEQQLGTGHAVTVAMDTLKDACDTVMVLYGDQPFIKPETIRRLKDTHEARHSVMTMMTTTVPDFEGWRRPFYDFGRIKRNQSGEIVRIIEKKDASEEELRIRELNPSFFCFSAPWLLKNLPKLTKNNAQGEYYLTDLVGIAIEQGVSLASLDVSPLETIGVNTSEHLEFAHQIP